MSKASEAMPNGEWRIYRGDNLPRSEWEIPAPPPWRPRRAAPELAASASFCPALSEAVQGTGRRYKANEDIIRLVNAALHLRRPLLITGGPGTGKSTLVDAIAYELGLGEPLRWAVTSRSTLREALYNYDAIGRMQYRESCSASDSQLDIGDFVELGPLGTAMLPAMRPRALLIDEIDKADIDLPNDLLNVLDEGRFHIPELSRIKQRTVKVRKYGNEGVVDISAGLVECYEFPLVILTSNGERDFPAPFLRRCLQLRMPDPCDDPVRLKAIVDAHLGESASAKADAMIQSFATRAQGGDILATDQLLNAIQLVMGSYSMDDADKSELELSLMAGLGRKI
ncbi:MoxR family ATPase [Massilia sp. DJPM01]|uniref:AAA family ATPase n=1 Tax=Massilia sp. DJPM01 TaxID=3024404 RepID=UPI00259EA887|nr:MoxR family ATPase [Massilia sp. DJPM01]MDM5177449.1 MoxR family ATPase [Massilia sp. DJPM01]